MAILAYVAENWKGEPPHRVTFSKGLSANRHRVHKDELRVIIDDGADTVLARIEIGVHDKCKLLSLLLADLIGGENGSSYSQQ